MSGLRNFLINLVLLLWPISVFQGVVFDSNESITLKMLIYIASVVVILLSRIENKIALFLFSIVTLVPTIIYREDILDLNYAILFIIPFVMCNVRLTTFKIMKYLPYYYAAIFLFLSLYVLFLPAVIYAGRGSIHLLLSGPHSSVYAVLILFVALIYLWSRGAQRNSKNILYFFWILAIILTFGYQVRTAILGVSVSFMWYQYYEFQFNRYIRQAVFWFLMILTVLASMSLLSFESGEVNEFSSGRVMVLLERVEMIARFGLREYMVGGGFGADILITDQWWWEAKASHNDFVSLIFNGGFVLFLTVLFILTRLMKSASNMQKAMLIFLIISSMLSTGLLFRPMYFLLFSMIFMLLGVDKRPKVNL